MWPRSFFSSLLQRAPALRQGLGAHVLNAATGAKQVPEWCFFERPEPRLIKFLSAKSGEIEGFCEKTVALAPNPASGGRRGLRQLEEHRTTQ